MNVLGVGPAELIVILVVALVFVGPERLPRLAADIARTIREIRKYTGGLAAEFNEVIQDFEKDTEGERSAWKEIETGITGATKSVADAVRDVRTEVRGPSADATAPPSAVGSSAAADPRPVEQKWAEIPSARPDADPLAPPSANGANGANGASSHAPAPFPAEETR
jgi:sec-independent protein translocase protein TatB